MPRAAAAGPLEKATSTATEDAMAGGQNGLVLRASAASVTVLLAGTTPIQAAQSL